MCYTTKLSPSVFRPVSLRYTTLRGHTPTMLLTTSTRDGIDSSPVMMARRRLDRDIIQSRCSAPFKRVTINSVIEKGSKDPKTKEDTFRKHRFRRRRSKVEYSPSLCEYSLPKYSLYGSASTCDPPEIGTRDAELPTAATTDPNTATSCVASTVKRSTTSTATQRKVPFSHVRMKAHSKQLLYLFTTIATLFHFLQQTIHKSGEFPKCQISIIGTPRVQFNEIVCN